VRTVHALDQYELPPQAICVDAKWQAVKKGLRLPLGFSTAESHELDETPSQISGRIWSDPNSAWNLPPQPLAFSLKIMLRVSGTRKPYSIHFKHLTPKPQDSPNSLVS
jgi:hypothetical protein